jgi:hypothetical protein
MRNAYKIGLQIDRSQRKISFGRPRSRWEDNIKTDLGKIGHGWIDVVHDSV